MFAIICLFLAVITLVMGFICADEGVPGYWVWWTGTVVCLVAFAMQIQS